MKKILKETSQYAMAAFVGLSAGCSTFQPDSDVTDKSPYSNLITTIKTLCAQDKNILLGDINHTDPSISKLISDPDVLAAIKSCDMPLVMEAGVEQNKGHEEQNGVTYQTLYEDAQSGMWKYTGHERLQNEGNGTQEKENMNHQYTLRGIYNAAKIDLRLIYPDVRYTESALGQDEDVSDVFDALYDLAYEVDMGNTQEYINFQIQLEALFNAAVEYRPALHKLENILNGEYLQVSNQQIIDNVKKFSEGKPVAMLYGYGHIKQNNDFDEMLDDENSVTIVLKPHEDQVLWKDYPDDQIDIPEYIYQIENDKIIDLEKSEESERIYGRLLREEHVYTKAEYDTAIGSLADELKKYAFPYTEYDGNPENDTIPENWIETETVYINPNFNDDEPSI